MQFLAIIALCILAAIVYGIIHDQITARICVEYFTIGHPAVFGTDDPTLLGLGWGVIATWWVGLLLGIPLALVARVGSPPKRSVCSLIRPLLQVLIVVGCCAVVGGVVGWFVARNGGVFLVGGLDDRVPHQKHVAFLTCMWTHSTSYLLGFVGGLVVIVRVARGRMRVSALS